MKIRSEVGIGDLLKIQEMYGELAPEALALVFPDLKHKATLFPAKAIEKNTSDSVKSESLSQFPSSEGAKESVVRSFVEEEPKRDLPPVEASKNNFPTLQLLCVTRAESFESEEESETKEPAFPIVQPISDEDLAEKRLSPGLPLQPLVPWSRLGPWLKARAGVDRESQRLDRRVLLQEFTQGLPLKRLPYKTMRCWQPHLRILVDETWEANPFLEDFRWFLWSLRKDFGRHGIEIHRIQSFPFEERLENLPVDVPILALSTFGQYDGVGLFDWVFFGRRLRQRGADIYALTPVPDRLMKKSIIKVWQPVNWETLGNRQSFGVNADETGRCDVLDPIQRLLAPCSQVEAPLLREFRKLLGNKADLGDEWAVWNHERCRGNHEFFRFRVGEKYLDLLEERNRLEGISLAQVNSANRLIARNVRFKNRVNQVAHEVRILLSSPKESEMGSMKPESLEILKGVVERFCLDREEASSEEVPVERLAEWFLMFQQGIPTSETRNAKVLEVIADGVYQAHAVLGKEVDWSSRIPLEVIRRALEKRDPLGKAEQVFRLEQVPGAIRVRPYHGEVDLSATLLGVFRSRLSGVSRVRYPNQGKIFETPIPDGKGEFSWATSNRFSVPNGFDLWTDKEALTVEPIKRPEWAHTFWSDQYGVAASFHVEKVEFVMRYIPAGRFWMGSPEDEEGKYVDEGPRHEVLIQEGFWLGVTPVTQAQWKALMWHNPSYFTGELSPVERVSWNMAKEYVDKLNGWLKGDFHLPTEAEWEYACRAGTDSAYNDGSPCTEPQGKDPALMELGWFYRNSGETTHPVKLKRENAWGLYDMHGNVWEWCEDHWRDSYLTGDRVGASRVVRGGSWHYYARYCRSASRYRFETVIRFDNLGFRLAAGQPRSQSGSGSSQGS